MKERNYGIELVRIIAMLMIVTLHCNLFSVKVVWSLDTKHILFVVTEFVSIVAVNLYMFISGYFLTKNKFDIRKIIKLELEVIFYSVLVYCLLSIFKVVSFNKKTLVSLLFPIINGNYWFYSCYAVLFFAMPILKKLYLYLSKIKKTEVFIIMLIIITSVIPSINPGNNYMTLGSGYSYVWFVTLVLTGAYLSEHNIKLGTIKLLALNFLVLSIQLLMYYNINKVTNIPWVVSWHKFLYSYNNILVFMSSVLLFIMLSRIKVKNKLINKVIMFFSTSTFGVYLIHTHPYAINTVLSSIHAVSKHLSSNIVVIYYIAWILGLFISCIIVDKIRIALFNLIGKAKIINKLDKKINAINKKLEV